MTAWSSGVQRSRARQDRSDSENVSRQVCGHVPDASPRVGSSGQVRVALAEPIAARSWPGLKEGDVTA